MHLLSRVLKRPMIGQFLRKQYMATQHGLKYIQINNTDDGYSILELNKKPVNSLNLEMCEEIVKAIDIVEADKSTRGIIVTSALPVFSAGLDILEMYEPNLERLKPFWTSVQEMTIRLFTSPQVTISAINGPCPAGGCMIAFSTDYRILADGKHVMGLNETHLGLSAPFWLCSSLKLLVGHRESERMLQLGEMNQPIEALRKGMVDQVVSSDLLMETSVKEMKKWLKIPDIGRIASKMNSRKHYIDEFHERRNEDLETFIHFIQSPALQKTMGIYLQSLKKKL